MRHTITTVYLTLAGFLLLAIGGSILLAPHAFYASNDIALGSNPTLLSEIRAPGGLLTATALLALISVVRRRLRAFAMPMLVLVYGSFGLARLVSITQDGIPANSIVSAMILELAVATIGVAILWRRHLVLQRVKAHSDALPAS
ncbi:MAG: DUF4345 domain-containing protein [Pseudomonadota bacterium]